MQKYIRMGFVASLFVLAMSAKPALAASRFWVGGTGNWSNTAHWAASSGGTGGVTVPAVGDTATLDGSSGGGTVTADADISTDSITMGAFAGTFNTNNHTLNLKSFSLAGSGARTLTMGSSAINLSLAGICWSAATVTNLTISANTAVITCSGAGAEFDGGAKNYNGTSLVLNGSGTQGINGASTLANVSRLGTAVKTDRFNLVSGFTVTGTLTLSGNSPANRLLVLSSVLGTARTITNTGAAMAFSNVDFRDVALSTSYNCSAIAGACGDALGNSGLTFTTGQTEYWVGNAGNWSATSSWSTISGGVSGARAPLPQDDVIFDNNSFNGSSQIVSGDEPRAGRNINWSAYNEGQGPRWNILQAVDMFGSLTLTPGMTTSNTYALNFYNRGAATLTSAGVSITFTLQPQMIGGSLTLQDNLNNSAAAALYLGNGTFNANNFNLTLAGLTSNSGLARTLNMGNGTWTIPGTSAWNITAAGQTLNAASSTIALTNTSATAKTFAGAGLAYNTVTFAGDNYTITGNNTFVNLNVNNAGFVNGLKFTGASTSTINSIFSTNATSTLALAIATSTTASQYYLKFTGSGSVCADYIKIAGANGSPGGTWYMGGHSTDAGNNSGLIFSSCGTPDTTPPSVPTNLTATSTSTTQINLSWTASTDNVGVTGYQVFRGGSQIATSTVTSYSDTGLTPSTAYTYNVTAFDAAGNVSVQSSSTSATTLTPHTPTTYYVSPSGSDGNDGLSTSTPWQTLNNINSTSFGPGDKILLAGGQTFSGTMAFDSGDVGTSSTPIQISSYGSGRATVNAGNGAGIWAYDVAGLDIENLNFVGSGTTTNTSAGINFWNDLTGSTTLDTIIINNVDVSNFGAIGIQISSANSGSGYKNITITNTASHDNASTGIWLGGHQPRANGVYALQNVYLGYDSTYNNTGNSSGNGNGITVSNTNGGTIEYSSAYNNGALNPLSSGPVGMWTYESNNITIQHNESYANKTQGGDGDGFDLDGGVTNSVMQYNYSHDNYGAGLWGAQYSGANSWSGNTIRYNISQNDARKNYGGLGFWNGGSGVTNAEVYNNVVYTATSTLGTPSAVDLLTATTNVHFRNNILITTGGLYLVKIPSGEVGMLFDHNDFYSSGFTANFSWGNATHTNDSLLNPKLNAPGTGGTIGDPTQLPTLSAYQLQTGSPMIDAGFDLTTVGINPGSFDFYGNPSKSGPAYDIGANEFVQN